MKSAKVYVDGSYNDTTHTGGAGYVMLIGNDPPLYYKECIIDDDLLAHRNVSGELMATFKALKEAVEQHVTHLDIYYDYEGIEKWATGEWQAKNKLTKWYVNQYCVAETYMRITFHKVLAHSGDKWNEKADSLAKNACLIVR